MSFSWSHSSDAASGWAGCALAHPEFGSSVNSISTRGADYAHHITASPLVSENPAASLHRTQLISKNKNLYLQQSQITFDSLKLIFCKKPKSVITGNLSKISNLIIYHYFEYFWIFLNYFEYYDKVWINWWTCRTWISLVKGDRGGILKYVPWYT